jgi:hypothetical protein
MQSSITHQACHSDFGGIYELNPFLIAIVTTERSDEISVFILAYCFTQPTGLPRLLTAEESSRFSVLFIVFCPQDCFAILHLAYLSPREKSLL